MILWHCTFVTRQWLWLKAWCCSCCPGSSWCSCPPPASSLGSDYDYLPDAAHAVRAPADAPVHQQLPLVTRQWLWLYTWCCSYCPGSSWCSCPPAACSGLSPCCGSPCCWRRWCCSPSCWSPPSPFFHSRWKDRLAKGSKGGGELSNCKFISYLA